MSDWFYSTGNDHRVGPVPATELISSFRQGRLRLDTLVWREGEAQWRPLREFATELDLDAEVASPLPPPLPSSLGSVPPVVVSAPPKSGLSGCMIALIAVAVVAIPMLGILAAIALPAYNDYTLRAKVAGALAEAAVLKPAVSEHWTTRQACPTNDDDGFKVPAAYRHGTVASITLGEFEGDLCGMELLLAVPGNERLDGKALWLEYQPADSTWHCSSEIDDKFLPAQCRG